MRALQRRAFGQRQLAEGVIQRRGGKLWIEPRQRVPQPLFQDDLSEVVTVSAGAAGRDVGAVCYTPANIAQPGEGGVFDVGLGDGRH